jgi:chromosome segregation ATPase
MGFCRYSRTPESPSRQHPRSVVITAKLEDIRVQTERSRAALASEMRQIRNFAILTPLRKSTRDRIVGEFEPLARRVKQLRLQIQKLECEREVLYADLMSFEEEMSDAVLQPEQSRTEIQREPSPAEQASRNHPTDSQPESLSPGVPHELLHY